MKLIIAGTRTLSPSLALIEELTSQFKEIPKITEVVSGKEPKGVDAAGERWAWCNKIPVKEFPADWDKHGRSAGPIRNKQMAKYADALLLIWDGESRGSASMKKYMKEQKKPVWECILRREL